MLKPMEVRYREGTTRYIQITCLDSEGHNFNLEDCVVQTYLNMGKELYLTTTKVDNILSFKIPAEVSVGQFEGTSETRIFKGDDVLSVVEIHYTIVPSIKPDIQPISQE